jgi:CBS domain-containing protein
MMNVGDIMVSQVSCCESGENLETAAIMMQDNDCGSIPVTDTRGTAIGMITDRDIAIAAAARHKALWEITTGELVTGTPVYSCRDTDNIREALAIMQREKVRRLAVINTDGRLMGVLSLDDIVACSERGIRGEGSPDLSYEDTMLTLKAVCKHH